MSKQQASALPKATQLEKDNKFYLKDALNEIQAEYADFSGQAQKQLKKTTEQLKKTKQRCKDFRQKLKECVKKIKSKSTKALLNRQAQLEKKLASEEKLLMQMEKDVLSQKQYLQSVKDLTKKHKALQSTISRFYSEYNTVSEVSKPAAQTKKSTAKSTNKKVAAQSKKTPSKPVKKATQAKEEKTKAQDEAASISSDVEVQQNLFMSELMEGQAAPAFAVKNDLNETLRLDDFKGKKVVLYFYPKDNTPGCTQQAKDFTEQMQSFADNNTIVLGVSRDSVSSHCKFKDKYQLNFSLLSDSDEALCQAYGVIKEKNRYGKMVRGIERSTFLINEEGQITRIWRNVRVAGHVEEVRSGIVASEEVVA